MDYFVVSDQLSTTLWYLILMLLVYKLLVKHQRSNQKSEEPKPKLPPGPTPWPIVGNLPEMLANRPTFRWIQKMMNDLNTDIACIRLGNVHVITISDPEIARELCIKQDAIFASRPSSWSNEYVTNGYLTTALTPFGEQWKKVKKVISNELVSPLRHKWLHDKRVEEADNIVRYVYNKCTKIGGDGIVNVSVAAQYYSGNVIRRLLLNKRYFGNGSEDYGPGLEEIEYVEAIFTVLQYLFAFSVSDFMPCLRGLDLDGHERIIKKACKIMKKYHDPIIEDRIQQWKNGKKIEKEDLLDVLISLKDGANNAILTEQEIKSNILELTLAAVDNPSNAVEWGLAELINQPKLLKKATEELDSVVGKGRLVQEYDFPKLNYVKACAKEAFRRHPICDFNLPRVAMKDTILANYFIPKGSHVYLRRQGLGTNPRIWEEPLKFNPERHLKIDGSNLSLADPSLNVITFGTGRRGCSGVMLGTSMTIMLFARLIHGFTWSLPPNQSNIDLSESHGGTTKAKPLVAVAKPRLEPKIYGLY
ncbi:putative oxidoreductase [Medicago truncatula]|uniref:Cytochrome P450 family protein n=1 Tax=Medicago truncatula TaxID=3880 RepID=G7L9G6_MEDTR|nr:isoleucine N-monooxygenase 2 [Medicago truncatula]AET03634.1 cytochrome P450 family protein [Medicago truncatula]RHN41871.1 putative oxidoreductase [Medicago truncatula]